MSAPALWTAAAGVFLAVVNGVTFAVYGADKSFARRGGRRVPERTLLALAFLGGSAGALLGMLVFHHKTRHRRFRVGLPLLLLAQLALAVWLITG